MSALSRVSFHFQAEKLRGFSGGDSAFRSSAPRPWERPMSPFPVGTRCMQWQVCSMLAGSSDLVCPKF